MILYSQKWERPYLCYIFPFWIHKWPEIGLAFSILERLCLCLKAGTSLIETMGAVKDMPKFSPRRGVQQYCQGKLFSVIASQVLSFSQKMWCSAIGTNFGTFLARIPLIAKVKLPKIFWHVFDWAGWHSSSGELTFCCDSS